MEIHGHYAQAPRRAPAPGLLQGEGACVYIRRTAKQAFGPNQNNPTPSENEGWQPDENASPSPCFCFCFSFSFCW